MFTLHSHINPDVELAEQSLNIDAITRLTGRIPLSDNEGQHLTRACVEMYATQAIPDEIKGKLFTPSFTTKSSGSGLGLAMCKNIIINAKGDITFESEVGKGTTFIVSLPVKK